VLRAGGRLVVSDIVLLGALPDALRDSDEMLVGCVANASPKEEYLWFIREAGFENVEALEERIYPIEGFGADSPAASVVVRAIKR
jgi:hypothetical protein